MANMVGNLEKAVAAKMAPKPGPTTTPSGWTQGKKTGWGGGTVPPGLRKQKGAEDDKINPATGRPFSDEKAARRAGQKVGAGRPGLAKGRYQVETEGLVSPQTSSRSAANRRLSRNTRVYNQGGFGKGKAPELTMQPKGNTAVAKLPSGQPVPRGRF